MAHVAGDRHLRAAGRPRDEGLIVVEPRFTASGGQVGNVYRLARADGVTRDADLS